MVALEALETNPFFNALEADERELLAPIAYRRYYSKGEPVFTEGTRPDSLRILVRGLVSFRQSQGGDDSEISLGTLSHAGDVFGIAAVVGERESHPQTAVCLEDTELIELDGKQFLSLCEQSPVVGCHLMRRLTTVMAERLAAAREQIRSRVRPGLISHG